MAEGIPGNDENQGRAEEWLELIVRSTGECRFG